MPGPDHPRDQTETCDAFERKWRQHRRSDASAVRGFSSSQAEGKARRLLRRRRKISHSLEVRLLGEIARDIKHQLARITGKSVDRTISSGYDRHVRCDCAIEGIQSGYIRLSLSVRPEGKVPKA